MVGAGTALLGLSAWFALTWFRRREAILGSRTLLWAVTLAMPLGFVGLEAGWFVTEVGRQPWIIQGVMRTSDAVTPASGVFELFLAFTLLYLVLGVTVIGLLKRIAAGSTTA
jgi:cytochrome d ubiquinol oxidase subunit I